MEYWQHADHCQPKWQRLVDDCLHVVQARIWRPTCVLCKAQGTEARDLCAPCERDLSPNRYACGVCALPLVDDMAQPAMCGSCQLARPKFDASFIPYRYAYPIDRLIQRLKYNGDLSVGRVLGELFIERLASERRSQLPDVIVPVPLASGRFRTRGFNQAIELAQTIAKSSGLEVQADIVERSRETQEQAGLPRKQRRRNVRGAFKLMRQPQHAHIAILDDVVTTGSTVNELAKVLRRAGVERIEVWAVARAARSA